MGDCTFVRKWGLVSILLFGSMLGWAVWSVIKISHTESWERPEVTDNGRNSMYLDLLVGIFFPDDRNPCLARCCALWNSRMNKLCRYLMEENS